MLDNRARSLQACAGPVRLNSKQPLMQSVGVQDTGIFDSYLLYEEPPAVAGDGAQTKFGTVVTPVAAVVLVAAVWLLHEGLEAPYPSSAAYVVIVAAMAVAAAAIRLAWKLDSTFRFRSNLVLIDIDGTYSQSRVRIGKSVYDSNESENTATRCDIRVNCFAGEALSETDDILNARELSGLAESPRAAELIELFRSDVAAFASKGVAPIGIHVPAATMEITKLNLSIQSARAAIARAAPHLDGMVPALDAAPLTQPVVPHLMAASIDEKICPDCAETVKAAAKKCRFCGYIFEVAAT